MMQDDDEQSAAAAAGGGDDAGDQTVNTPRSTANDCTLHRHWYAFLCASLITFFAGLLLVLSWRIIAWTFCQRRSPARAGGAGAGSSVGGGIDPDTGLPRSRDSAQVGWMTTAQDWAGGMISGQTTTGRILVSIFVVACPCQQPRKFGHTASKYVMNTFIRSSKTSATERRSPQQNRCVFSNR